MFHIFIAGLRESLQCSIPLALLMFHPSIRRSSGMAVLNGAIFALLAGALIGKLPGMDSIMQKTEAWAMGRHISEAILLYAGVLVFAWEAGGSRPPSRHLTATLAFGFAFLAFFFEARSLWFFASDLGASEGTLYGYKFMALFGMMVGLQPLVLGFRPRTFRLERFLTPATALLAAATLKVAMGGVQEIEDTSLLVALSDGLQRFVESATRHAQGLLLITPHQFIKVPLGGLADYFSEDRISTSLLMLFVMTPPVLILWDVLSRPEPKTGGIRVAAERRLAVAFFRREMGFMAAPLIIVFITLIVMLHSVNASMNPLSEPTPMPIREEEGGRLMIHLADRLGNMDDGKLRKYVFLSGGSKVILISIMKPDGTLGVALDECEICNPAEWNTNAFGYAQKGEHLICKYCMTPIAISTLNQPGGCNPIPVPFEVRDDGAVVRVDDLMRVYKAAKELQKKGTHF